MSSFNFFSTSYNYLHTKKSLLFSLSALAVILSVLAFFFIDIHEDIGAMLPEEPSAVREEFNLLKHSPLSRKVVINLRADTQTGTTTLIKKTEDLARALAPPYFTKVVYGPPKTDINHLFSFMLNALPSLVTEADLKKMDTMLEEKRIRDNLAEIRSSLASPGAWPTKDLMRKDPLGFRFLALEKLKYLNTVPRVRLQENHFISGDGRNTLILAETPVEMTDSSGSRQLLNYFKGIVDKIIPENITVTLMSGHRYSAANAETVERDLIVVLSFSSLAILILFLIYIRSWILFVVFLVPASVVFIASVVVSLVYKGVSAITIGFGSVILGISVDYAVHVYFALRSNARARGKTLAEIARPVIFGGLTSLSAFSVLIFSNLPGQRQLALFAMTGLCAALILCLFVLPQLIPYSRNKAPQPLSKGPSLKGPPAAGSRLILLAWSAIMILSAWQAFGIVFDGDLRSLNLVTKEIRSDDIMMQETWGDIKGRAMVFVRGRDMESALRENDRLFSFLKDKAGIKPLTSLASILPSSFTQEKNQERWREFWDLGRITRVDRILAAEGGALGFSPHAFQPFLQMVAQAPRGITFNDLHNAGFAEALDSLVVRWDEEVGLITLVPDTDEMLDLFAGSYGDSGKARIVSQSRFGRMISSALEKDFIQFILYASLGVVFLLFVIFRNLKKVLAALIPVITGLVFMAGAMGFFGIPFNLFNIVATILVIGLGVDYGIFMVCRITEGYDHSTERAVLVSGLTTLAGFGALVLAGHPALHSIGITVLFGIGAAIPSALFVVPAIYGLSNGTGTKP